MDKKKVLNLLFYSGILIWINIGKTRLEPERARLIKNYHISNFGIYELNSIDYRYGKQPWLFFIHHDMPLLTNKTVKRLVYLWKKKKDSLLYSELKLLYPKETENTKLGDPLDALNKIAVLSRHLPIDLNTEKYLPQWVSFDPKVWKAINDRTFIAKRTIQTMYPDLKAAIPAILILGGVLVFAIAMQHVTEIIGALGKLIHGN